MKSAFPTICGSARLRRSLADSVLNGVICHAYILEGPASSDKRGFAMQIAAALACENKTDSMLALPCGVCESCRRILGGSCQDVIYIGTDGAASIGIDRIRRLKESLVLTPGELDFKAYIIDGADKLTIQAQNSLLKLLEEPPGGRTLYLLLSENPDTLLNTVRSRAPVLRLSPPSREETAEWLNQKTNGNYTAQQLRAAAAQSGGSPEDALAILEETDAGRTLLAERERVIKAVELFSGGASLSDLILYFSSVPAKKDEMLCVMRLIYSAVRDIITVKRAPETQPDFFADKSELSRLAQKITLRSAVRICDAALDAVSALTKNASPKNVQLAFAAAAHSASARQTKG